MQIYNFITTPELSCSNINKDEENFIITNQHNLEQLGRHLGVSIKEISDSDEEFPAFFAPEVGYDVFSFVFFKEDGHGFEFERITLYLMNRNLIIVIANQSFYKGILDTLPNADVLKDTISCFFYFLDLAFSEMFASLCQYEEHLSQIENQLLMNHKEFSVKDIISEKGFCLRIKKYARILLYSSEDLNLNLNGLIPEKQMRLFSNINAKINMINEMSNHLYERCTHLLNVYDSTVNTKSNNLINKLTVINFFATPFTIISGIYGMNFVNMPELRSPYGYYIAISVMLMISFIIYKVLKRVKLL